MDLHRIGVKFFLEDPAKADPEAVVPVLHRWIQSSAVPGTLIDVADYAHLPQSPGVVLVAHEWTLMVDETEGPRGLLMLRKAPLEGALPARIAAVIREAAKACAVLEREAGLPGARFRGGEAWVLSNDRLEAPNTDAAWTAFRPAVEAAAKAVWGAAAAVERDARDPRSRLIARVKAPAPGGVAALAGA
jgi:hypothetical protein